MLKSKLVALRLFNTCISPRDTGICWDSSQDIHLSCLPLWRGTIRFSPHFRRRDSKINNGVNLTNYYMLYIPQKSDVEGMPQLSIGRSGNTYLLYWWGSFSQLGALDSRCSPGNFALCTQCTTAAAHRNTLSISLPLELCSVTSWKVECVI